MKKAVFIILCMAVFMPFAVEARTCEYGMPSPPIYYNGNWAYGQVINFKTSASSCLADNMYVYFSDGNYLSTHNFTIEAYLMEKDKDPNPDDKAKLYFGYNSGYSLMKWTLQQKFDGNFDSAGDQTCELYMKFRLKEPLAHNNVEYFDSDMFRYTICMD